MRSSPPRGRALGLGVAVNVPVVDAGAHLKTFIRMDGAVLRSIDVAMRKARAALLFECPSEAVWDYFLPARQWRARRARRQLPVAGG